MSNTLHIDHWTNASIDTDNTSHRIVFRDITDWKLQELSTMVIGNKSDINGKPIQGGHSKKTKQKSMITLTTQMKTKIIIIIIKNVAKSTTISYILVG